MTLKVIDLFLANKISVVAFPAHSNDRTNPLDVSVFGPLKKYSNAAIAKQRSKNLWTAALSGLLGWTFGMQ